MAGLVKTGEYPHDSETQPEFFTVLKAINSE
jgi:hypothetical protein